jgi:hypothetical protein
MATAAMPKPRIPPASRGPAVGAALPEVLELDEAAEVLAATAVVLGVPLTTVVIVEVEERSLLTLLTTLPTLLVTCVAMLPPSEVIRVPKLVAIEAASLVIVLMTPPAESVTTCLNLVRYDVQIRR